MKMTNKKKLDEKQYTQYIAILRWMGSCSNIHQLQNLKGIVFDFYAKNKADYLLEAFKKKENELK